MGWGCYKHEWDAGSESWREYAAEMCNKHLAATNHADWGRDAQICPKCYDELIAQHAEVVEYLRAENEFLAAANARLRARAGEP